jgi:hypothetical protein
MSLAIFMSVTARPRSAAIAATIASSEPCAANLLGAVTKGWPVSAAFLATMARPKSGGALSPVPTAVPQGKAEPVRVAVGGAHQLEKIRGEAGGAFQTAMRDPGMRTALRQVLPAHQHVAHARMSNDKVFEILACIDLVAHQEAAFAQASRPRAPYWPRRPSCASVRFGPLRGVVQRWTSKKFRKERR